MPKRLIVTVEVPDRYGDALAKDDGAKEKLGKMALVMGFKVLNVEILKDDLALDKKS